MVILRNARHTYSCANRNKSNTCRHDNKVLKPIETFKSPTFNGDSEVQFQSVDTEPRCNKTSSLLERPIEEAIECSI